MSPEAPTASPSPSPPLDANGFPAEILGMPVMDTSKALSEISGGRLDGRVAAVAGYVIWPTEYCTIIGPSPADYLAHHCEDPLLGGTGQFDDPSNFEISFVPETSGGASISRNPPGPFEPGTPVVLVGHTADVRAWQCTPAEEFQRCWDKFVVDRVAWLAGHPVGLIPGSLDPAPTWIPGDEPEATILSASPSEAGQLGVFDPRLNGATGGTKWFTRYAVGEVDSDGTRASEERIFDDPSRVLVAALPSQAPNDYTAGTVRLRYEFTRDFHQNLSNTSPVAFDIADGLGGYITSGRTDYDTGGSVVVEPGTYELDIYLTEYDGSPRVGGPECSVQVAVEANTALWLEATFGPHSCSAKTEPS